jgi:phosphomannomutase/phosphoglucomutase
MSEMKSKEVKYTIPEGLIISPSGMRGVWQKNLPPYVVLRFCEAFGTWLKETTNKENPMVLIGMDTRTTGPILKHAVISGLLAVGCNVIDTDVCPTPVLMFGHKYYQCDGTVIISASHNPPEYNGIKCLAPSGTFLSREELEQINKWFIYGDPVYVPWYKYGILRKENPWYQYVALMMRFIDLDAIKKRNQQKQIKIVFDPGAGAGTKKTDEILRTLGCNVVSINENLVNNQFPRSFEPIKEHLTDLEKKMAEIKADVGFAHDCDADRIALIDEKGYCLPEDIILAIIVNYMLEQLHTKYKHITLVTNCASSITLEKLGEKYHANVIRTPVGERYLASKMMDLLKNNPDEHLVFGGEGSCGGVMLPVFNNARDGMFAAIKVIEILAKTGKTISQLVDELPKFYTRRIKITLQSSSAESIMTKLKKTLTEQNIKFDEIDQDVRIADTKKDEWVLVHPSNTEPIIRIISEAPTDARAIELCNQMNEQINRL